MLNFLKENIAFVIGVIVLVGLYTGISTWKKTPSPIIETSSTTTDTTNIQTTSNTSAQPAETQATVKKTSPAPASIVGTSIPSRFQDVEENQRGERHDD